jgi:6-phosphofructokinase
MYFNMLVQKELRKLKLGIGSRPVEMGFELRCTRPIGYDLTLCTLLGLGVYKLFKNGNTECMVTIDNLGTASPLFLK